MYVVYKSAYFKQELSKQKKSVQAECVKIQIKQQKQYLHILICLHLFIFAQIYLQICGYLFVFTIKLCW